jgi:anti-sigma regulatory factor (Ser/Thr protein kinase)
VPPREPIEKFWRFHSSSAQAARVVRRQIVNYLRRESTRRDELLDAELVIGEILANTVVHAPGLVEVRLEWLKEHPTLTVTDSGPGNSGRGTFLIRRLACDVSVVRMPDGGTRVSAVLPLRRSLR